jgi:hypothetical protein
MLKGLNRCIRSFYQAVKDKIQNGSLESPQTVQFIDPELVDKVIAFTQEKIARIMVHIY